MDDQDFSSSSSSSASFVSCCDPPHYAFSGKLMLISVLVFFFVCLLIAYFYLYSNRLRLRRDLHHQHLHRRHHHRRPPPPQVSSSQGLDPTLLKSLPVFVYEGYYEAAPIECPVCLAEFEIGEMGRVLPKCSHCFHCECIDMWFRSHSSCPICRAPVQSIEVKENNPSELEGELAEVVIDEVRPSSSSSSSDSSQSDNHGKKSVEIIAIITS